MTTKKPNILHVSTETSWRGGEQQLAYLVEELNQKGLTQHVICKKGSEAEKRLSGSSASVHTFGNQLLPLSKSFTIKSICKSNNIHLIHTHDSGAHSAALFSNAFMGNRPPIVVSRRVDFPVKSNRLSYWKYNHQHIKLILCVSNAIKDITGERISNKSVLRTVYDGIDTKKFNLAHKTNDNLRKEFKVEPEYALVGNVAAIAPHKDYFTFVKTVHQLVNSGVKAKFFIIGEGNQRNEIESFIKELELSDHIILTGFRNDIPLILPQLDCFLFTSSTEGLGTSLLDAFACKVPIVGTNAGGAKELLYHNKTAYVAPVQDHMALAQGVKKILSEKDYADGLTEEGFRFVQGFSKEEMASRTLKEYYTIL